MHYWLECALPRLVVRHHKLEALVGLLLRPYGGGGNHRLLPLLRWGRVFLLLAFWFFLQYAFVLAVSLDYSVEGRHVDRVALSACRSPNMALRS